MGRPKGSRTSALRDRARYRFDRTLARSTGTLMGWLVITCLVFVLPVSAVLVWTDPTSPRSLPGRLTAAWRTSAETLRLGTVPDTPLGMVLAALLGTVALLCVSTLVGVITTGLTERMAELSRGRSTVLEQGHVVVLGWSDQVATVVGELVAAQAAHRPSAIVVLADRDKTEMERALAARTRPGRRTRIICRSGPASDPAVLAVVSPRTARTVLVLPSGEATADAEVLRILLALRAVLADGPVGPGGPVGSGGPGGPVGSGGPGGPGVSDGSVGPPVLAMVRDDRYRAPARLAAGPRGTVLQSDTVTARLIAQCAGRPGLSLVLRDLLDFAGDEFHLADATGFHGRPFGATLLAHAESCVLGLRTPQGRTLLNPPADTVVAPGSSLIVLAQDDDTTPVADCRHLVDRSAITSGPPSSEAAARLLLLGWNRRAPLVVGQLRRTARPGSVLDVITDQAVPGPREPAPGPGPERAPEPGAGAHGGPDTAPPSRPAPAPASEPASEVGPASEPASEPGDAAAGQLCVRFHSAALSRPETLLGLDLAPYDGLVVLGPDPGEGPERPDDWTLVTLLALRLLEERTGRELGVVTELTDDRNRPLAPVNPGSDVIVSGQLTGLLMAQIAQNRHLAPVFDELFSAEGSTVCLRGAGAYVRPGREATFATVVAAARDRGECAIGYRRHDRRAMAPDHGVRLNPHKGERRSWSAEDEIVVVASDTADPAVPTAQAAAPAAPAHAHAAPAGRAAVPGQSTQPHEPRPGPADTRA
ncbi:CASTOR/POLLUX-related putative ion channel [Streptomyces sp. NBC_01497]|uniref:CASTOR/POLLUX-related putative ion channel n=1 Tax=Streptomyces sp. NBC_01497 TaxID=2903885 RepID=UPI002E34F827|nr:NAD-binding lipoprotein [Streptomyces sp. NBC_01497]